ncbi:Fucoxanthin-chlorophyll a-c binding protein C [Durusdinium trenchii]|uniref:Chloroplastic n=1 Tax=Durusdinium trenchii TaxID=1381693 RepID=A0ABP0J7A9_9DINO
MLEQLRRVPEDSRLSEDALWKGHVKSWVAELGVDAPPRKPAEMYTVAMLISLEALVTDDEAAIFARALAWVVLCMVWGAMRCDDVQSILPHRMIISNFGLSLTLGRSKTSGPDKPQKELVVHILRTVSLTGRDWLRVGMDIWQEDPFKFKRDYLVMEPTRFWDGVRRKYVPPSGLASLISCLLSQLGTPKAVFQGWDVTPNQLLLPDGLEKFFTGHSPRNFMTSVAAVIGFSRDERAFLGRWSMGTVSAEEYVRTSRQVVFKIQRAVNRTLIEGGPEEFFEDELIDKLCKFAEDQGANPSRIAKRHRVLSIVSGRNCLGGVYPALEVEARDAELVSDFLDEDHEESAAIARRYGTLRKFSALADDRAAIRTACLHDFAIPQDTPQGRAETAAVVSSWEIAKEFLAKEVELRAEAKVLGQPRILQIHERQAMLKAVEAVYGSLGELECLAPGYLSLKAEETEANEPTASPLDEIISKQASSVSQLQSAVDSTGLIRVTRMKSKSKMPANTEEYRKVMKVEMYAWLSMASRYRSKHWLHGLTAEPFTKFVEYILGERVLNIQIPTSSPEQQQKVKPDWTIILAYEHKLRREAMKLVVNQGHTLADALHAVIRDADLKEAFFTTPVALKAAHSSFETPPNKFARPFWKGAYSKGYQTDKGKGKGKKGKGKHKQQDSRLAGLKAEEQGLIRLELRELDIERWPPKARGERRSEEMKRLAAATFDLLSDTVRQVIQDPRKEAFRLVTGKLTQSPFPAEVLTPLRSKWAELLSDPGNALVVDQGQPFLLRGLAQWLGVFEDPDAKWLVDVEDSFASGVCLGVEKPLPRSPQVCPPKVKHRKLDESEFSPSAQNYASADMSSSELEAKFREEEALGRMFPSKLGALREQYGDKLRVASMAAIKKPDGSVRPLHDGTHSVRVNNVIRYQDQLECPGPGEIAAVVRTSVESREAPFCVSADIKAAHRLVKIRKADWGYMCCRVDSSSETVWVNQVGTFGISSAPFWWSKLCGLIGRFVMYCMQDNWLLHMIYVDDLHGAFIGQHKFWLIWVWLLAFELVGVPFGYHKFHGGFASEFVGFNLRYDLAEVGISEKRGRWLLEWITKATTDRFVVVGRSFIEFLGRLGFVSQLLTWLKPHLSPLFAWAAVVAPGTVGKLPDTVILTLKYIDLEFKGETFLVSVNRPIITSHEIFRTDAKCAEDFVVLGGWELSTRRWFSLRLTPHEVPFLFQEGKGAMWASTSAELLASLVALGAFGWITQGKHRKSVPLVLAAGTDNRANDVLSTKRTTTKWPLMGINMQLSSAIAKARLSLDLRWRPREENEEADSLTNEVFDAFDLELRVPVTFSDLDLSMVFALWETKREFDELKERARLARASTPKHKVNKKVDKSPW